MALTMLLNLVAAPGVITVIDELEVQAEAACKSWPAAAAESLLAAAGRTRPS